MRKYSVTFVLPGIIFKYPPGGYDIVFRLANILNERGISCSIIFLTNSNFYVPNYVKTNASTKLHYLAKVFNFIFYGRRFGYIYHHWESINKLLFRADYDYSMLKNTDCYLYKKVSDIEFNTNMIIATFWETAYFVSRYIRSSKNNSKGYYLIQNDEDDVSFSGENSDNAKATYKFDLKKIVINKRMYTRFKEDDPIFFHIGINTSLYKLINPIYKRDGILFPLRNGESKGAKYALECIEMLLNSNFKKKIIAFGDYPPNEIPHNIMINIDYYYKPRYIELLKLYNESMIFVLPSIVEGMPSPPLEAMSCGCAVLTTENGGVNEYITDGINGIICPVRDSNCLFEKLMYLVNDKNKRNELVKNGLDTAKRFSYEYMYKDFIDIVRNYI